MVHRLTIAGLLLFIQAFPADKDFSVSERFNITRAASPISGGIAFGKGELASVSGLSLFRGTQEIPGQFIPLTRNTDNSIQWVLVDFSDNFNAGEKKSYTIRNQAAAVQPVNPVVISRSGSVMTFDNGFIRLSVDTLNFKGIQSLEYKGTAMLSGDGGLRLLDVKHGTETVNGPVTKARLIYQGALRTTLRVEGEFFRDSAGGVGYAYLLTVFANSPQVAIAATLRNSINPAVGRAARLSYATARFELAYTPSAVTAFDTILPSAYFFPGALDTLRTSKAFDNGSGKGFAVTERWAGGLYPANINRTLLSGRSLDVEIIRRHSAATTRLGYVDSVFVMRDLTHKTSEIFIECFDGASSASALRAMARSCKGRLRPLQDPRQLSDANALSAGRFGTLDDENAAYAKWGWTIPADVRSQATPGPGVVPPAPQTDMAPILTLDIHGETETDPPRNFLTQWVRTGMQSIFDVGESWSRYYRDHVTWRTTGFVQDGQYQVGSFIQQKARRLPIVTPVTGDAGYNGSVADYNSYGGCHTAMEGMADYYCLTGDIDALEALVDYGEMELARTMARPPDSTAASKESFSDRATGRKFAFLVRLYELTRDQVWWDLVKLKATSMLRSNLRHPLIYSKYPVIAAEPQHLEFLTPTLAKPDSLSRYLAANRIGFGIGTGKAGSYPYQQMFGTDSATGATWPAFVTPRWEGAYIAQAFSRYFDITGDENARDMLIGYAQYIKFTQTARCRMAGSYANYIDVPRPGKSVLSGWASDWDPAHAICYNSYSTAAGGMGGGHSAVKTVLYPSIYALAYSYTGFPYLMDDARAAWNRGSKYMGDRFIRDEKTVHAYAFCGGYNGANLRVYYNYHEYKDDYVFQVCHAFREAARHTDTIPPERVTNLFVRRTDGNTGVTFEWTAPADAAEYQVKYFKGKRIQEYPDLEYNYDKFYSSGDTNRVSWWYAVNVPGEPLPAPAGAPQSFTVTGDFPATDTFYAVLCSRDTMNNLSLLSNTVMIDVNTTAREKGGAPGAPFALRAKPNPFNPAVELSLFAPKGVTRALSIRVFNASGRLVREFTGPASAGKLIVSWDGRDSQGRILGSGTYLVRTVAGDQRQNRMITLVK